MAMLYNPYAPGSWSSSPVYETNKIGGVYYPTLPPSTPGANGVPQGWNVGGNGGFASSPAPRPSPLVKLPLGGGPNDYNRSGPILDLPKRPDGSFGDLSESAARRWARRAGKFARRHPLGPAFDFAWFMYRMFNEARPDATIPGADGYDYHVTIPSGWIQCTRNDGFAPGTGGFWPPYPLDVVQDNPGSYLYGNPGAICPHFTPVSAYGPWNETMWYGGIYTAVRGNIGWTYSDFFPWVTWRDPDGSHTPADKPISFVKTPSGTLPTEEKPVPVALPAGTVGFTLDPSSRPIGVPSGWNVPLPYTLLPGNPNGTYNPPGTDPTPGTDGPPRPPRPPRPPENPHRPDPGVKERKRRWGGKMPLSYAKDILNTVTEGCDAIDALWQALPGDVKWTPGVPKTCDKKAADLWKNVDKLDWDQAIMNLLQMYAEDKLWGKYFQLSDKAAAGFGMPGWKLDQPITSAPQVPFRGI